MNDNGEVSQLIARINWQAPWLARYKAIGEPLAKQIGLGAPVHAALNKALAVNSALICSVRFVPQADSQGAAAYESFIWQTKTVPTRDNLHDFFNGLVWLHFPKIKAKLNKLQAAAILEGGVGQHRGKLRDALTLFDENAGILICKGFPAEKLSKSLIDKDWQSMFIEQRGLWADTELVIFGHALLEKLVAPRKAMTAHVFCPPAPLGAAQPVDAQLAAQLNPAHLATKPYAPLPVMGVPGWCAQNEAASFYDDAQVFRAAKLC